MRGDRRQFLAAGAVAGLTASNFHDDPVKAEETFTYFCARVPYNVPGGRYVKRLDSQSPLEAFQNNWQKDSEAVLGIGIIPIQARSASE